MDKVFFKTELLFKRLGLPTLVLETKSEKPWFHFTAIIFFNKYRYSAIICKTDHFR